MRTQKHDGKRKKKDAKEKTQEKGDNKN